jgi:large subunit ribosomal protein L3
MTTAILGQKVGMTQIYTEDGVRVPVTVIEAGPCPVVQVKSEDGPDGYNAIQVAFGQKKAKRLSKAVRTHYEKHGNVEPRRWLKEFRLENAPDQQPGDEITVEIFEEIKKVDVSGNTKGRGFAGTIKRHNFSRGPRGHGSMNVRRPGSIGMAATPKRVLKGHRMAGHYGNEAVTVRNLDLVGVDHKNNFLFVKGGVPGPNGGLLMVRASAKQPS